MIPTLRSVSFMCNTTTDDAILRLTTMDQKSRQTRVMLIVLLLSSSIHIYRFPSKDKFHWNWLMFIAWKVRTLITLLWKIHLIFYEVNNTQRSFPYVEWIYQVPDDDFKIHFCFCSTVKWVLKIIIKIYYYTAWWRDFSLACLIWSGITTTSSTRWFTLTGHCKAVFFSAARSNTATRISSWTWIKSEVQHHFSWFI